VPAAVLRSPDASALVGAFPHTSGSRPCVIVRGGGAPPGIRLPATCTTLVQHEGPYTLVTFTERWRAHAFHGQGSPTAGESKFTYYFVVSSSGPARLENAIGDFMPQLAR
jgi:hypothetical protein